MKTKEQNVPREENVPTALAFFAIGAGLLVMAVVGVLTEKFFGWGLWSSFIGGVAWAVVFVGIIRLVLGRLPLRPWVLRALGRET
ncbi:MAG: hypothetical protein WBA31_07200 [Candidatus Dormiibacterota bacterium]